MRPDKKKVGRVSGSFGTEEIENPIRIVVEPERKAA